MDFCLIILFSLFVQITHFSCVTAGFGESGDPSCLIMQIWARIEVSREGNLEGLVLC